MLKIIDVYEKYREVAKEENYYSQPESKVLKALKFKRNSFIGLGVLVTLGAGILFLVAPEVFLAVAISVGLLGGIVGLLFGGFKFLDKAYDHYEVLNRAKHNGVRQDD